jgi:hypothetical protein
MGSIAPTTRRRTAPLVEVKRRQGQEASGLAEGAGGAVVIDLIRAHGVGRTLAETAAFLFVLGSFYVLLAVVTP